MDLFFSPMTCSLASRISIYETGLDAKFHQVTLATKTLDDGRDYLAINPKGQVPALKRRDGAMLTEGPAVLQYIADLDPQGRLAPPAGTSERYELQQWLNYIATEVHKAVFYMIFHPASPPEAKAFARGQLLPARFDHLSAHLKDREFLLDRFSVADAYLVTTRNWTRAADFDLGKWPVLGAYHQRIAQRPAVAKAIAEEMALRAKG